MPPMRTSVPAPLIKPLKTERSHEENQERAYIAASRRSDRSLEARVESARRASEIHKRRTGRSLRVTEQDVINEEMYEEEDDDLPLQYRRLTAHLQTGSPDFNRRLHAYIQNQVAMRTALSQAVANQRFAAAHGLQMQNGYPQMMFNTGDQSMQPQQQQQQQQQQQSQGQYPTSVPSPTTARTMSPSFHPYAHNRSASFAVSSNSGSDSANSGSKSDMSKQGENAKQRRGSSIATANTVSQKEGTKKQSNDQPDPLLFSPSSHSGVSPLSTSLPLETQTFFQHPSFNMNQLSMPPFNMNSAEMYTFDQSTPQLKSGNINPRYAGMSQTLAPPMLDTKTSQSNNYSFSPAQDSNDPESAMFSPMFDSYNNDNQFVSEEFGLNSGVTADHEFSEFLDSSAFADSGDEQTTAAV